MSTELSHFLVSCGLQLYRRQGLPVRALKPDAISVMRLLLVTEQ